jgi:hypothetical protein
MSKIEIKTEFGLKLPPIENGKETIQKIIGHLSQLLNEGGIDFSGYAKVAGKEDLNLKLKIEKDVESGKNKLAIEILDPQPRLEILSLLKSNIVDITVDTERIAISIDNFPDLEIEVKS